MLSANEGPPHELSFHSYFNDWSPGYPQPEWRAPYWSVVLRAVPAWLARTMRKDWTSKVAMRTTSFATLISRVYMAIYGWHLQQVSQSPLYPFLPVLAFDERRLVVPAGALKQRSLDEEADPKMFMWSQKAHFWLLSMTKPEKRWESAESTWVSASIAICTTHTKVFRLAPEKVRNNLS